MILNQINKIVCELCLILELLLRMNLIIKKMNESSYNNKALTSPAKA